ncbi:NADP-binding protein [Dacryopinax primogenitus]|uniref:NADP-binding protein n=1 Tax=Dacryopinax primogenitus (strain DJM 731) TaxID=1858805 RepID=M5FWD0_DACPD|nr:NADP-binding protein [Dacryopinax primogenitus]EJT99999.1 NADP-binding protein [Dacryopinax primogenitus]
MKVLVLGGTGYVGYGVACAFSRAGHETAATYRNESGSADLAVAEIAPVPWRTWDSCLNSFDVIVDCMDSADTSIMCINRIATCSVSPESGRRNHPVAYIYTSGIWVHGASEPQGKMGLTIVDERNGDMSRVPAWYQEKVNVEALILNKHELMPIIVRPGLVYGQTMGMLNKLFKSAWYGKITCPENYQSRWSTIHLDDLANLYVNIAEAGLCFDACNLSSESAEDVIRALSRASGCNELAFTQEKSLENYALSTSMVTRPSLARSIVGWQPRKMALTDGMELYWMSWILTTGIHRDQAALPIPEQAKAPLCAEPHAHSHLHPAPIPQPQMQINTPSPVPSHPEPTTPQFVQQPPLHPAPPPQPFIQQNAPVHPQLQYQAQQIAVQAAQSQERPPISFPDIPVNDLATLHRQ